MCLSIHLFNIQKTNLNGQPNHISIIHKKNLRNIHQKSKKRETPLQKFKKNFEHGATCTVVVKRKKKNNYTRRCMILRKACKRCGPNFGNKWRKIKFNIRKFLFPLIIQRKSFVTSRSMQLLGSGIFIMILNAKYPSLFFYTITGENILLLWPDLGPHILLGLWHRILTFRLQAQNINLWTSMTLLFYN